MPWRRCLRCSGQAYFTPPRLPDPANTAGEWACLNCSRTVPETEEEIRQRVGGPTRKDQTAKLTEELRAEFAAASEVNRQRARRKVAEGWVPFKKKEAAEPVN